MNRRGINWDAQPLGIMDDRDLAKRLKVPVTIVQRERQQRSLGPADGGNLRGAKGIDWDAQPLGKVPDHVIADRIGVTSSAVGYAREIYGIPLYRPKDPDARWRKLPLGKEPDRVIARRIGVSWQTVILARKRLGIPPHSRSPNPGGRYANVDPPTDHARWNRAYRARLKAKELAGDL